MPLIINDSPHDASPLDILAALSADDPARNIRPQFCSKCGTPWRPDSEHCPVCDRDKLLLKARHDADAIGVRPAIELYFLLLAVSIGIFIAYKVEPRTLTTEVVGNLVQYLTIAIAAAMHRGRLQTILRPPARPAWFAASIVLAGCTYVAANCVLSALHQWLGVHILRCTDSYFTTGWGWTLSLLLIAAQPALFEELAFRGIIQEGLASVLSPTETVIVGAALFAILHLTVLSLPHLMLMGIVLGCLRFQTGSLLPGMLLHFTHNAMCVLFERFGS